MATHLSENLPPHTGKSSNIISDHKEKILSAWEARAHNEVRSAVKVASLVLRNSLPLYLDHLSAALATNRKMDAWSVFSRDQEGARIGKLHGADRADNTSYYLTDVIFEYHILREVIFQVLEVEAPLPGIQRDIILDSIEQAVNDAVVKFSEVHADIQEKFINTLTHDLKNPLSAAKTYAQLISKHFDKPETVLNSAKRIIGSVNRLDAMVRDLLDAGRVRAGEKLSIQFVQSDLNVMIRDVIEEMSAIHGDRFVLNSKGAVDGHWGGDEIRRAVENLIGNAVKYSTPDTPITVSLISEASGNASIQFKVHNQGPPISENEIPLLFEHHRRAKSALDGSKPGWGLGLTLVKGVVEAHNGRIRVESEEGKGTSFIIEIPFARAAPGHL